MSVDCSDRWRFPWEVTAISLLVPWASLALTGLLFRFLPPLVPAGLPPSIGPIVFRLPDLLPLPAAALWGWWCRAPYGVGRIVLGWFLGCLATVAVLLVLLAMNPKTEPQIAIGGIFLAGQSSLLAVLFFFLGSRLRAWCRRGER